MIKEFIFNSFTKGPLTKSGSKLYCNNVPVFMLHITARRDLGVNGQDPELIRESLSFLRKKKFNFVTIDGDAKAITAGKSLPPNSVALTLDDGYFGQTDNTVDIFAEFDIPTTYYMSTFFITGDLWYWNDKIEYLVEHCPYERITTLTGLYPHLDLHGKTRQKIIDVITEDTTLKTSSEKEGKAEEVVTKVGLDLPLSALEKYKPTLWSKFEIEHSCEDLNAHLEFPSQVFCYLVGRIHDFSEGEASFVKELGNILPISSMPGAVGVKERDSLFAISRFSFPDTREDFFQYVTWIESFKTHLRQLDKN